MTKYEIRTRIIKDEHPVVEVKINDKWVRMHGYLVGIQAAFALKKKNKYHNIVLITGGVGVGKSTFVQGLAALDSSSVGKVLTLDNFSWKTETLIQQTDREDNEEEPEIWDEAIKGATGRSMALTEEGNDLKITFVTKRRKRHTYYLIIDEITEYAWKLIKMADCWIHIKKIGLNRGYFNVFANKSNIKWVHYQMKEMKRTWSHPEVKKVRPDCRGKFDNWEDLFIDGNAYEKKKIEETRQTKSDKVSWSMDKVKAYGYYIRKDIRSIRNIALEIGISHTTLSQWYKEFDKVVV